MPHIPRASDGPVRTRWYEAPTARHSLGNSTTVHPDELRSVGGRRRPPPGQPTRSARPLRRSSTLVRASGGKTGPRSGSRRGTTRAFDAPGGPGSWPTATCVAVIRRFADASAFRPLREARSSSSIAGRQTASCDTPTSRSGEKHIMLRAARSPPASPVRSPGVRSRWVARVPLSLFAPCAGH